MIKIPKKITPDPIIDSIVELRFKPVINKDEVFGKIFSELNNSFQIYQPSQIPKIRIQDNVFAYVADATISNQDYSIGIGSNVISFNCKDGYKGWGNYFALIKSVLLRISEKGIIEQIERIGVRYINFFSEIEVITKHLNLFIDYSRKNEYVTKRTSFITEISQGIFSHRINIADGAILNKKSGSLIDIDTSTNEIKSNISEDLFNQIEACRIEEKKLFFTLLKEDFIEKFNPEYA
ncbi:MAG: TIGR04255 family protein [Bacteroidetes bacterium]|nr:TIGR04255 family protein [Bacteroidota bacterium]